MRVGYALGTMLYQGSHKTRVLIGYDTRASASMLCSAISSGLCSAGVYPTRIGVITTPGVAYLTKKHRFDAGVMISASHNSYEYNGIKIFTQDGYKLPDEVEERIESIVSDFDRENATLDKIGYEIPPERDYVLDYVRHLRACSEPLDGLKIAIDCANGASCTVARELFSSLGAICYMLGDSPNGYNINDECGSTDTRGLRECVLKHSLDCGIALDGDADRLIVIDERGEVVDGDMIMASLAYDMKKRGALIKSTIVATVMSNYGLEVFCKENGISLVCCAVGDRYVLERMLQDSYNLGGEQSGHIILSDFSTTGDGLLSALCLLSLSKRKNLKISALHSVMKKYPQFLVNLKASDSDKLRLLTDTQIKSLIERARVALGNTGRILVRPSGTEGLIRIMVQAQTDESARAIATELGEGIAERLGQKRLK